MGWCFLECPGDRLERIVDRHDCRAINPDIRYRSMAELEDFQQPGSRYDLRADVGWLRIPGPSCSMLSAARWSAGP